MAVLEIEVHRYHISLVSGSITYQTTSSSRASTGDYANIHPALLDPTLSVPSSSTNAPAPKKRKRKSPVTATSTSDDTFRTSGAGKSLKPISEADLMAFHQSHSRLFAPSTSRPSQIAGRRSSKSTSPNKTVIPLSSPSSRRFSHTDLAPRLVPYSSSSQIQCSSSFDGALTGTPADLQDALDEEEVDELATVPRPPRRHRIKDAEGTPTGVGKAAKKSKGGVGRLAELRGGGGGGGGGVESPLKVLNQVSTPLKSNGSACGILGTKKKEKEKRARPVWQVNTPEAGYGSR